MIIQSDLERKRTNFHIENCSVDQVVELPPAEFAMFMQNLLDDYDFIRKFNEENHPIQKDTRSCLLVLGEHGEEGVLIDPQGYNYARYSAYIPHARSIIQQEQYPSLNDFADEMRWLVDKYTQKAVSGQIDCQYSIDLNEAHWQCRNSEFNEELFMLMLSERPEFESVDWDKESCCVTISEPYLRQEDEQNLRKLNSEEMEVMCAKHILWLHDAGGEQADFSNCLLADVDLSRKNLINAIFDGAKLSNVKLQKAELCFASCNNTKFHHCDLTDVTAEEAEFKSTECIGSNFNNGCFTHSNFTDARSSTVQ